jgi:hypothetical protein
LLKKLLIAVAVIVALLVAAIAMQPSEFRVTRTASIAAAPAEIFPLINDFHNWDRWSPWAKLDPNMKTTYAGAPAGVGAVYSWVGNSDVGEGRMTITESQPTEKVGLRLEFLKPFAATSTTEFTLKPGGNATKVEWTTYGPCDFMSKAFSLFMGGMDKMMGPDFEKGLAQMKAAAEKK